ncbi:PiggyBac transposable element-derived protein 4 [Trichinella zimbabwensis]|uniref:PiggyBac transposable element-derived protein 4 n=1 Tax=Trichinella zimbabwensis TaxID=268475 RepID=A0A0V1GU66_9BILA|nr:PiggyBac transposable element-derived protein 4 [Trichinella zimbabwensis]
MMDVSYQIVLQMTNLDGKRLYKDDWKQIDETEFHAYIGLLILAGVYNSHGEATNSFWNTENGRPIFLSIMSLDNFQPAIRDIWDDWVARLPMMCNPGAYVTADERLISFKGRCSFRQYMLKKPANNAASQEEAHHTRHHKEEQARTTTRIIGIKKRAVHSSKFVFTEQCTAVSYIPKKHRMVLVLSTMHKDASLSTVKGCKPEMSLDYNASKGGVDNMDKMLASYTSQRMTAKWPLVVFYNIIDVSANNGYLLWTHCNPEWNASKMYRRRLYLEELGKASTNSSLEVASTSFDVSSSCTENVNSATLQTTKRQPAV